MDQMSAATLRALLVERLDLNDVRDAAVDLGFDDYEGLDKRTLVRRLIQYVEQRNQRARLLDWLRRHRPDLERELDSFSSPLSSPLNDIKEQDSRSMSQPQGGIIFMGEVHARDIIAGDKYIGGEQARDEDSQSA